MKRREFLGKAALAAAALTVKGYVIPWRGLLERAEADTGIPLASLRAALDPNEALLLLPSDAQYAKYQNAFNLRTALKPQARVLVRSARGVTQLVQWLKANGVAFAIRGGGHSFEGFSQSSSVVIDTRMLNKVELDATGKLVTVGGGAALGEVYAVTGAKALAIPGGTCPPVGVSGHVQGGGFGLLARPFGLACDSLVSVELVDAKGEVRLCSETQEQDLFWALRGGGGGSFGVATRYVFRTHLVRQCYVFGQTWVLPPKKAAVAFKGWQQWIQQAPNQITSTCRIMVDSATGNVNVHVGGISVGAESQLRTELARIYSAPPQKFKVGVKDFPGAVRYFAGGPAGAWPVNEKGNNTYYYDPIWMKGKSDYLYSTMSDEGMLALFEGSRRHPGITAMFDGYGGAVGAVAPEATAFAHRKALCSVQYYSQFPAAAAPARLQNMKEFHDALRPHFSGHAYVNYPDLDLGDRYGDAYWGDNFTRLRKIKAAVDPENFFRHAQSVPPATG